MELNNFMSKFVIKNIKSVCGKQVFKQLVIVENNVDIKKLQQDIDENKSDVTGVFDDYENSLEDIYKSSLNGIITIMNLVADLQSVPVQKLRDVTPKKELVKEFEFKYGDLRVYAIKIPNGKLILLGGYKNNQKPDFAKFRSLKGQYLESIKK